MARSSNPIPNPFLLQALPEHEAEIPETVRTVQLIKDLAKEIRLVEVRAWESRLPILVCLSDYYWYLGWQSH